MKKIAWCVLLLPMWLTGCMSHPQDAHPNTTNLTVGTVQGEIREGMSASEVATILGSPNIVTTDEKRREVWIYDKVSSNSVDTSNSAFGSIFILGARSGQSQSTSTQRTLTIIIKFDENKTVRDFSYNSTQF